MCIRDRNRRAPCARDRFTPSLLAKVVAVAMSGRLMRGNRLKRGSSTKHPPEPKRLRLPAGAAPCALCGKTSQDVRVLSALVKT
eukprot:4853248-Amphidinium_carterae.6